MSGPTGGPTGGAPVAQREAGGEPVSRPYTGVLLAAAALLWLTAMLLSARVTITGREQAEMEVTSTAYALPGAVSASLVAGAAVALAVLALLARGGRVTGGGVAGGRVAGGGVTGGRVAGATGRLAAGTAAGLATGLLAATSIVTINVEGWLYAVMGGTLAAAGTIGGAAAGGVRVPRVPTAVCWAGLTVFAFGFGLNLVQVPLLELFGAGDTRASQAGALNWFAVTQSIGGGLAAGLVAYAVLRRHRGADLRWPLYALAGAGPGAVLLVAEALARTAGARVLDLAGRVSELELVAQDMLSGSRINNALIVMFVGAVTAIIAVGRTLGPAPDED